MRLNVALSDKVMDLRLRDKLVAEGKITPQQLADYEQTLVDDFDNAMDADIAPKAAAPAEEEEVQETL